MSDFNKVYAVGVNAGEYQLLQETMFEQSVQMTENDLYTFDGKRKGDAWRPVSVDWLVVEGETPEKQPDIAGWGAMAFAIPERLKSAFEKGLGDCVELLPLDLNGETWYALNILGEQDAIDPEKTEYNMKNGRVNRVRRFKKLVLDKQKIACGSLFKVKGAGIYTFCTDQTGGFYELCKSLEVSGLKFAEVEAT
ncbi:hypothetical protein CWC31_02600 [Pseudoalteromonas ruthenica]|uniref:hypothetical protein n=1 Tax=Pseudoalteromonas ruthenica TaxID=151081 RepID=UPI001108BE3E|nr:hypothetical protein [Pseudoalteromonas ruthenica]TLX52058.1 hypothetical protein CWC31_02600 [Pseudoalteromonas ruthenica]